ncbi:MAG: PDZ domain-containing protein [Gemmatimonadaceae bacterium]
MPPSALPPATLPAAALLAAALLGALPLALVGQDRPATSAPVTDLRFEVTVGPEQLRDRRLDVTVRFRTAGREPVLLSMPAWTPGSYEIANFAKNVSGFTASQSGRAVRWDKLDPDTWRIVPTGAGVVELRYRARADELDVAASWTAADFAFFNGTTLFLAVEGRTETPATVVVRTAPGWLVATGMTPDDSTHRFRATDFHDLVDHPVFVGRFDLDSTRVQDKWMRLATWPVGSVDGRRRAALWDGLSRSVEPLLEVFGEVPWTSYTVLQVADDEFPGMSALEHSESELAIVGTPFLDEPFVMSIHAHELAHAWNVKRLRPADLVPYRYDAPQPTPWLWVSEGITDYYADLALVRSGLIDETGFLEATLKKMESVANRPPTALEDASVQAWLGMRDGTSDLYYDKGSLAGLALDILIRDASDNSQSLDAVMRELWDRTWKQGRGFTHDDFWNAVARATRGRSFGDFARRYIDGRDAFPWEDWLPRAGWRLRTDSIAEPRLGALLRPHTAGVLVSAIDPAGAGARAGLQRGDVITRIGGRSTLDPDFGERWRSYWGTRPGAAMPLEVRRGEETVALTAVVETLTRLDRQIVPDPRASSKARRIRAGILAGRQVP